MDDPVFTRFVEAADEIRTSGRWAAVNAAVERLAGNPGAGNEWYVQVVGGLCFCVFSEYLSLKRAYEDDRHRDSSLLAWRARNLLELSVWSIYAAKSRENARRLYEDAGRDARDVLSAFSNWGVDTAQTADWIERVNPLPTSRCDVLVFLSMLLRRPRNFQPRAAAS
jgi:plasmid stabilization system protein ParE